MKNQSCKPCAEATYSLGTGIRFDEWDELPHGFASTAANLEIDYSFTEPLGNCSMSTWVPKGDYIASNTDECTATLMYAVNLKQSGTVSFEYIYTDSSIVFEFFVQNDQCQPSVEESRWMRTSDRGWETHSVELSRGNNVLYWRTTAFSVWSKTPKPVLTQLMYKWAEPKICTENLPSAVKLPPSGVKTMCPPCNPGFFKTNTSSCEPCPYGSYSNGSGCINCPVGTEPAVGFEYKWWNTLPANMETTVLSGISFEYKGMAGWEVAGDYIYTAAGASDNDFMILTLVIPGFSPPQSVMEDSENKKIATITFVFETICSVNCELYFMVGVNSRTNTPVETWVGSKGKQSYTYVIDKNATMSFTWAFQRTAYHEAGRKYTNDVARIYSINVTNVIDGVASYCRVCALESSGSSCTSCPHGHYIDRSSGGCQPCPANTYLKAHQPYGSQACIPCGPGTKSNKIHSLCYNDCHLSVTTQGRTLEYDFSALANSTSFLGGPSFTSKGLKYFHHFNISLCGNHGRKTAVCTDNVTDIHILGKEAEFSKATSSYVCQSVIVPSDAMGFKTVLSSQPVSLADRFIGVTTEPTLDNITSFADYFPAENMGLPDVIFFYRSNDVTQTCSDGRATAIRVRCDPLKSQSGALSVPSKCPEGTCDGCTFHFLWETVEACPLCSADDYHAIISACIGGIQRTTYVWREPKLCAGGIPLPEQKVSICKTMDFWLKVGISAGTCAAVLLTVMTCYFWKKNQKLEYKYSKLVMNASAKESELPAADSCAIMEGEDAEDDLIFASKNSLFGKIKAFTSKRTSDGFDSVPLKTSSGTADMDL
ncbi:endosome/lysosome-associated apoptosis and autophagy regulator 1 isoform X4 [Varanus komodoensis]|uniref:endosome/lysosome-associated apoptosis and autophagy regulator 1 isoform X4 n=1 Tax=Varanus komodoensis TaxID=61221 RepID=UPI001CF7AF5E|nr:endosome/lysosome-associated apoptosis and autophagy regulator 1 isoform X4 [Varanus komodoensis]